MQIKTLAFRKNKAIEIEQLPNWDSPSTLVTLFASPKKFANGEDLKAIAKKFSNSHVIGCSTSGEIFGDGVLDGAIVVAVAKFENTMLKSMAEEFDQAGTNVSERAVQIGKALVGEDLAGVFVLSSGLSVNGTALVHGIQEGLGRDVQISGGLAGDGNEFVRTWILHGDKFYPNGAVALGLYGKQVQLTHGCQGGWDYFGVERVITRAEGNCLYELDGRPALDLYKEYLGDLAAQLPSSALYFPLCLKLPNGGILMRTVLGIDETNKSMTFAGDLQAGMHAHLMKGNFERLIQGATKSAKNCIEGLDYAPPFLAIAVSCVGRRIVLGQRTDEEIEESLSVFPTDTSLVGFYSYGEISPSLPDGNCELHNQTMTFTAIHELLA